MFAEILFRPLELFLNRGLEQSTSAQALARQLEGRTLGFTVEGTPLDLRLKVSDGRIAVGLPDGTAPDACVRGTALALGRILREDAQPLVREGAVQISGDSEMAELFRELLRFATPDLEEELSRLVGDPLARQMTNAGRAFTEWGEAAGRSIERSVADYLQQNSKVLPTRAEVDELARQVDQLVDDVARAEARLERLEKGS